MLNKFGPQQKDAQVPLRVLARVKLLPAFIMLADHGETLLLRVGCGNQVASVSEQISGERHSRDGRISRTDWHSH